MIEYSTPPKPKDKHSSSGSALKRFVIFLFAKPTVKDLWVLLAFITVVAQQFDSENIVHYIWTPICILFFYLSYACELLREIRDKRD